MFINHRFCAMTKMKRLPHRLNRGESQKLPNSSQKSISVINSFRSIVGKAQKYYSQLSDCNQNWMKITLLCRNAYFILIHFIGKGSRHSALSTDGGGITWKFQSHTTSTTINKKSTVYRATITTEKKHNRINKNKKILVFVIFILHNFNLAVGIRRTSRALIQYIYDACFALLLLCLTDWYGCLFNWRRSSNVEATKTYKNLYYVFRRFSLLFSSCNNHFIIYVNKML